LGTLPQAGTMGRGTDPDGLRSLLALVNSFGTSQGQTNTAAAK
jgi:hypothetical protein